MLYDDKIVYVEIIQISFKLNRKQKSTDGSKFNVSKDFY